MQLFRELGEQIEESWRARDYNEEVFPSLAAEALQSAAIPSKISAWEVVEWALTQNELPPQKDPSANFGDPPITLFVAPRFYIDVYFWLDGTTEIHQHSFCGAFQVLMGSSIHSWYDFAARDRVNSFTEIGDMELKVCQLLVHGDIQEIQAGRRYIHSLFHLDQPSATIVVRTDKSPLYLPQYSYHKPYLATDPFYSHETTNRKLQTIGALFAVKHPETDRMVTGVLEQSDFQTSVAVLNTVRHHLSTNQLDQLFNLSQPVERFRGFLDVVRRRHGERAEVLPAVFSHRDMQDEIVRRRGYVTNPEHRFFLALLLNVEGRDNVFKLVGQRYPDAEPLEKVLDWVLELAQTRVVGGKPPNALGIENFGQIDLALLEGMLNGKSDATITDELRREVGENTDLIADLEARLTLIREALIFRPLFA